jgi:hypothetical protein
MALVSGFHLDCSSKYLLIIAWSHPAGTTALSCIDSDRMALISGFHLDCSSEYLLIIAHILLDHCPFLY